MENLYQGGTKRGWLRYAKPSISQNAGNESNRPLYPEAHFWAAVILSVRENMKTPSRLMPPYLPEHVHWWKKVLACSVLGLMLYVLLSAITRHPWMLALFAALAVTTLYSNKRHKQKLMDMAEERAHEGICTFARSFDRNQVDMWVIRAVYDELQQQVKFPECACPLRASDTLEKDLEIDPDDIEDLLPVVAQRTGRSLEHTEGNPFFGKIETVGDFVLFINAQQKIRV